MSQRGHAPLGADFARLWAAVSISTVGDGVSEVAYPWLASTLTRDARLVALVPVALRLPWLLVSLPAGALVDRVDRRRLIVRVDSVRFLLTAGVAIAVATETVSLPLLLVALLLLGSGEVLAQNASLTMLPSVVEPAALDRGNSRLQASDVVARGMIGPPVAGVLIALSLTTPFALDAVSFAAAAALVAMVRRRPAPTAAVAAGRRRGGVRAEIGEGLRWLWAHPVLRLVAITLGVMNALFGMAISTEVLYARETLGLGAFGFGLLFTGGAFGGLVGSLIAARVVGRLGMGRTLQLCLVSEATSVLAYGLAPDAVVAGAAIALFGVTGIIWNVVTIGMRQRLIPDALLGRVGSVYRLVGIGAAPVGSLLGGLVVTAAGSLVSRSTSLRAPMLLASAGYVLLMLGVLPRMGRLREPAAPERR